MCRLQLPSRPQAQLPAPGNDRVIQASQMPLTPDAGYPNPPQQPDWVIDMTPLLREPPRLDEPRVAA